MRNICILITAVAVALCAGTVQAGAVLHYSFDTDYTDSSGAGNNGTAVDRSGDSVVDVSITNTVGEYVFGGGAADFTATRDCVQLDSQILFGSGNAYSVSFWARDLSTSGGGMVLGVSEGDWASTFFVWAYKPGDTVNWRGSSSSADRNASFTQTLDSDWHHYALVAGDYDGDSAVDDITLYRDGAFVGTDPGNLTGFIIETIGSAYGSNLDFDWIGQIDEVWVFDEALSLAAVDSLYNANVVPEPTTMGLLLCGLLSLAGLRTARRKS